MSKEVRNLAIAVVVSLVLGYVAGGVHATGRCPITGMVVCKTTAAKCDHMKECASKCDACEAKQSDAAKPADAAEAPKADEAAKK